MKSQILIVDDYSLLSECLYEVLSTKGVGVITPCRSAGQALSFRRHFSAGDVIILSDRLVDTPTVELIRQLREQSPEVRFICLATSLEEGALVDLYRAGVDAFVTRRTGLNELLDIVRIVAEGGRVKNAQISQIVLDAIVSQGEKEDVHSRLSPREVDVLRMVADGKSTKQIASVLNIASSTVSVHRREITNKLDLRSIAELTKYAVREGLSDLGG